MKIMKKTLSFAFKAVFAALFLSLTAEIILLVSRLIGNDAGNFPKIFGIVSLALGMILAVILLISGGKDKALFKILVFRTASVILAIIADLASGKFSEGIIGMMIKSVFYAGEVLSTALAVVTICFFVAEISEKDE